MANNFKKYQSNIDTSVVEARFKKSPFTVYNPVVLQSTTENNVATMQQANLYNQQNMQQEEEVEELLPSVATYTETKETEKEKAPFLARLGSTIRDIETSVEQGVMRGVEGFVDWGASLVGQVGSALVSKFGKDNDLIGQDNKDLRAEEIMQATQDFIKRDLTKELTNTRLYNLKNDPLGQLRGDYATGGNALEKFRENSFLEDAEWSKNYIRGTAEAVGQMLPSIAGGGNLYFFGSAFGGSMEEALNQGASFADAETYGFLSGVTETAIEGISGGIGGVGEGLIGKIMKSTGNKTVAKLGTNKLISFASKAVGEGAEEVASELIQPYIKRATIDPDAPSASTEELLQSFIIGAAAGAIMQGGAVVTSDYMSDAQQIDELIEYQQEAYNKGRFSDASAIAQMIEQKSQRLGEKLGTEIDLTEINATNKLKAYNKTVSRTDANKYVTAQENLQSSLTEDLQKMSKESRQKFIQDNSLEYMYNKNGTIKKSYQNLTLQQKSDIAVINKTVKGLDSSVKVNFVTQAKNVQGYYSKNNNTITINLNAEDPYRVVGLHEFTHSLEGSKSYNNLRDFVVSNMKKKGNYAYSFKKLRSLYKDQFNQTSKVVDLKSKLQKGEITQQEYYDQYNNMLRNYVEEEMVAKVISEEIFSNKKTINELIGENESLGKKILNWITKKSKGTDANFEKWRKELKTAKKLYQEAIAEKRESQETEEKKYYLKEQFDSTGRKLTQKQIEFFKNIDPKLLDENGRLKPFYHGTQRMDRVGYKFNPKRATSGPMAFFTDKKEIAKNYAESKKDTSLYYEDYDTYSKWFKYKDNKTDFVKSWLFYPAFKQQEFIEKASHITFDEDGENIIYDENTNNGLGNYKQALREYKNNAFGALVDGWLDSGNLINEEHKFMKVLKLLGLENNYTYDSPNQVKSGVFEVYLNITKAFDTSDVTQEMIDDLEKLAPKFKEEELIFDSGSDMWDKNTPYNQQNFIERLKEDLEKGTTYAWTSIPDYVTDYLKSKGYDGIIDKGGKYTDDIHTVVIPFYSNQVKDVNNLNPTDSDDIRYSLKETKKREPRVETTKKIPTDYVTGKAEAKQLQKYGRKSTAEIYNGLINLFAIESDTVKVKGGKSKVVDFIFQQVNTNKLTIDQISEKLVDYVLKNVTISNEKIPTVFRNELLNNFRSDLTTLIATKGKDTFRLKMFERIDALKEKIEQRKLKDTVKGTISNLKSLEKFDTMNFKYSPYTQRIANVLGFGVKAFSELDSKNIDNYTTREKVREFVAKLDAENKLAKLDKRRYEIQEIPSELLEELKQMYSKEKISNQDPLTSNELRSLNKLISFIKHTANSYVNKKEELSIARAERRAKETVQEVSKAPVRPITNFTKVANNLIKMPILIKQMEGSSTGESYGLTKYIVEPMQKAQTKEMENIMYLSQEFNAFNEKYKNFQKKLANKFAIETVDVNGNVIDTVEVTLAEAITIYELSKRDDARRHFMPFDNQKAKGINVYDKKGNKTKTLLLDDAQIESIENKFDEETKEYIDIVERFFNEKARMLKIETDVKRLGYTNVYEGFYFPISVDQAEMDLDFSKMKTSEYFENLFGQSFNQNVLEEANNALRLKRVDVIIADHINRLSKYNAYMIPATNVDKMMNTEVDGKLLHALVDEKQAGFYQAMREWFADFVQTKKMDESKALAFFRSTYATYVLGFNAKSTVTQLTAYPLALKFLSAGSMAKGLTAKFFSKEQLELMDMYCPYVRYRNFESSVVTQEANLKGMSTMQKVVMSPITFMDRFTIGRIWMACQFEVEKLYGHKVGSEANLKKSGELLEKIMRDTQAVDALEQPKVQRKKNALTNFVLMFSKQSTQMLNSLVGSVYEYRTIQDRIKKEGKTPELLAIKEQATNQLWGSMAGTSISILSATLIARLFAKMFKKDDEEQEDITEFLIELGSNTFGMVPYLNQFYSLIQGYDLNISLFTSIENLYSAFKTIPSMLSKGEYEGLWYKFSTAIGPFVGVPFKNINEIGLGVISAFNPELGYKYRNIWYNQSVSKYAEDLEESIGKKDTKTTSNILKEIYREKNIDIDKEIISKITPVISSKDISNKSVLFPKTANQTITYDSTEYTMSNKQYKQFKQLYSANLNKYLKSLTANSRYASLTTQEKAQAIKYIQDYAYFTSFGKTMNVDTSEATKLTLLGNAINPVLIATVLAKCRGEKLKGNKAEIQKYINSIPGITREQKYLLYGMLGYKPLQENAYVQVSNYLSTKGYTVQQIHTTLVKCKFIEDDEE